MYKVILNIFKPGFILLLVVTIAGKVVVASSLAKSDSLKQQLSKTLPDTTRIDILLTLGNYQDSDSSLIYIEKASALADRINDSFRKSKALIIQGEIYRYIGAYGKALTCNFYALRLYDKMAKRDYWRAHALMNIGNVYYSVKKYALAVNYLKEALAVVKKIPAMPEDTSWKPKYLSKIYNGLGSYVALSGKVKEGIVYFNLALQSAQPHNQDYIALAYNNLAESHRILKEDKLAEYYYHKALRLGKPTRQAISSYEGLGQLFISQGKYNEASKYLLEAERIAKAGATINELTLITKAIAEMYEKQGDLKNALKYYHQFQELNDSVLNITSIQQMNVLQTKYETEKKDKELKLANAAAEKEQSIREITIIVFVLVVLAGIVITRNLILRQRVRNKILNEKNMMAENDIIRLLQENTEAKYEILKSKTNPHFLFNSFNTLSSIIVEDPNQAVEYVERFSSFYRTILKTGNQALISLHDEMQIVKNYFYLQKMRFEDNLIVNINITIDQNTVFVPALAVQMLVENVIKHNRIRGPQNLLIDIYTDAHFITIKNNLQKKHETILSTSTGHKSITGRYALITDVEPSFRETASVYIARIPLLDSKSRIKHGKMKKEILR